MKTLRTAVIGLGRIGWQFHLPQITSRDGFDLVAVADPLEERREQAKSEFGARGYSTCGELLEGEGLDLVVVASPTPFHADHAEAAFEAGCDVFCEKPMAASLAEADRMVASAKSHGRKLMLFQPHRAGADLVALREILGLIGPVYMIKRACSAYTRREDWQAFRKNAGGMLNNYGAHFIDQVLHLSGSRAKRVFCALRSIASLGDADDVVKVVIETEGGMLLDVDINMASAQPMQPWHILGNRGSIVMDQESRAWHVRLFAEEDLTNLATQQGFAARDRRYGSGEKIPWQEKVFPLSDFQPTDYYEKCYEYFAMGAEPFVPMEESRELMRVLNECRQSAGWGEQ
ncbi:MAG: Gfo/Idh/MocA family oxidoreductase [Phycisphaerae bacterium]|jgi:predicted dehydrogenase|nr:Gfo/Idh/MocA family oxidoreductase [Phycisphaerae bacterium]